MNKAGLFFSLILLCVTFFLAYNYFDSCNRSTYPALCFTDFALKSNNPDTCKNIERLNERDKCFTTLALAINQTNICERINSVDKKDECLYALAYSLNEAKLCDLVNSEQNRSDCFQEVGSKFGFEASSINDCKLYNLAYEEGCLEGFAEATKNEIICAKIINDSELNSICYQRLARLLKNPAICSNINITENKRVCEALALTPT